jgi:1-deoxy-D-xylulose-5-phosphate synthase
MFDQIPTSRPATPLLDTVDKPADLRKLKQDCLEQLSRELRHFLLYTVGQTGGHFGAGLGVVELTVALHYVFNTPDDGLIWDVGHQTYPHKILTGRRDIMHTLRQPNGLAPFPSQGESEYDVFGTGHSSTSISAALGIELANKITNKTSHTVVVIGDGAMTAGMAFEALNHVAACQADLLVILNDNAMSISENVGGLANYFARNISARDLGDHRPVESAAPGSIFTDLGFNYTGPIDGHDIENLVTTLQQLKNQPGPRLLHLLTRKGKGYGPAERSPVSSHSLTKLEKQSANTEPTYSNIFGNWVCRKAEQDQRLVAITPAMKEGSDLSRFAEAFPDRFHDVAIAEQHAVTLAAGLATGGAKPVVAIYSTFLQRAYDQLIHDVAIQNLDVLFAVDRASLLEDGPTHSGVFDLSFTRAIPNLVVMAPSNKQTLEAMLDFGYEFEGPCIVRYPRGAAIETSAAETPIVLGNASVIRTGSKVALLSFGTVRSSAELVADKLDYTLVDMRFAKPLDQVLIEELSGSHQMLVTIEENAIAGGAGSGVNEIIAKLNSEVSILNIGVPDRFFDQDQPDAMLDSAGLSATAIEQTIIAELNR